MFPNTSLKCCFNLFWFEKEGAAGDELIILMHSAEF